MSITTEHLAPREVPYGTFATAAVGTASPTPTETVRYLTTAEVGEALRTPSETVRYWRHVGKGPRSFKIGRRVLYAVEDVEAFIAEARGQVS